MSIRRGQIVMVHGLNNGSGSPAWSAPGVVVDTRDGAALVEFHRHTFDASSGRRHVAVWFAERRGVALSYVTPHGEYKVKPGNHLRVDWGAVDAIPALIAEEET